jgi:hypothetical protein
MAKVQPDLDTEIGNPDSLLIEGSLEATQIVRQIFTCGVALDLDGRYDPPILPRDIDQQLAERLGMKAEMHLAPLAAQAHSGRLSHLLSHLIDKRPSMHRRCGRF